MFVPVKRKKKKRSMPVISAGILLVACGFILFKGKPKEEPEIPEIPEFSEALVVNETKPESLLGSQPKSQPTVSANTPQVLKDLAKKNPETVDYVNAWPGNPSQKVDISGDYIKGQIPHFLQWDLRWGYQFYGGMWPEDYMGLSGCGPTSLSMVVVGMTGNLSADPGSVAAYAEEAGYATSDNGTMWSLISEGSRHYGLEAEEVPLNENDMIAALNRSPIICVVGPGDFTQSGHFMVLTGYENGKFTLLDPNSKSNSEKMWSYERLQDQILAMWEFSVI